MKNKIVISIGSLLACIALVSVLIAAVGPPPILRNAMTTNQNVWEKSGSSMTWTGNVSVAGTVTATNGFLSPNSPIYWGAKGKGTNDDSIYIQTAVNSNIVVRFPPGIFSISRPIQLTNGTHLIGSGVGITTIIASTNMVGVYGQNQGQMLESQSCSNITVEGITFNGSNWSAGASVFIGGTNNVFRSCEVLNYGSAQGVLIVNLNSSYSQANVLDSRFENGTHGVELWKATNSIVRGNNIHLMSGAGIWHSQASHCLYVNNVVSDCGDLGIDMEAGDNCTAVGNIVSRCNNGEFSLTDGGDVQPEYGLTFSANRVDRGDTYTTVYGTNAPTSVSGGALHIISLSSSSREIAFIDNTITVSNRYAFYCDDQSSRTNLSVSINGNSVLSVTGGNAFLRILGCSGVVLDGNVFKSEAISTGLSEFKNCSGGVMSHNNFIFQNGRSGTNYSLLINSDAAIASNIHIVNNSFVGAGQYGILFDGFNAGRNCFVVGGNTMGGSPVLGGGIAQTANAGILFDDQRLKILLDPIIGGVGVVMGSIPCLGGSDADHSADFNGLLYISSNDKKNCYRLARYKNVLYSQDGTGNPSGMTAEAFYFMTFSGDTITPNNGPDYSGGPNYLDVVLNSTY